jgi:hypothetical protein
VPEGERNGEKRDVKKEQEEKEHTKNARRRPKAGKERRRTCFIAWMRTVSSVVSCFTLGNLAITEIGT